MMTTLEKVVYGFSYGAFRTEPRQHMTCYSDGYELGRGLVKMGLKVGRSKS